MTNTTTVCGLITIHHHPCMTGRRKMLKLTITLVVFTVQCLKKNKNLKAAFGSCWPFLTEKPWAHKTEEKAAIISIYFLSVHLQSCRDSHQSATEHGSTHLRTNKNEKDDLQSNSRVNKEWWLKGKKGREIKKENKDCHEMYPQICGKGLAYKMSTYIISIPNVTLTTRYLPMQTTNQMPAPCGDQIYCI